MSCKKNPYENPQSHTNKMLLPARKKRKTYTRHPDAVKAAKRAGGNSRVYRVKGGYRITKR